MCHGRSRRLHRNRANARTRVAGANLVIEREHMKRIIPTLFVDSAAQAEEVMQT
jgi:hypothetical protein